MKSIILLLAIFAIINAGYIDDKILDPESIGFPDHAFDSYTLSTGFLPID